MTEEKKPEPFTIKAATIIAIAVCAATEKMRYGHVTLPAPVAERKPRRTP